MLSGGGDGPSVHPVGVEGSGRCASGGVGLLSVVGEGVSSIERQGAVLALPADGGGRGARGRVKIGPG